MLRKLKQFFIVLALVFILLLPYFVFAATMKNVLLGLGDSAGYTTTGVTETSFSEILGLVVSGFLSLLGIIFIGEIIYAGYSWMTARGEEEKVERARETIRRAIIGLVIVVGAFAIAWFVESYIL